MALRKMSMAVWKFASCDGCQLSLLNCEDEFLTLAKSVKIAYFPEASRSISRGPYDLSLVEGSITTRRDVERIKKIRKSSRFLVAIGACATTGGIQALRNFQNVREFQSVVYARPEWIETLDRSEPVSSFVRVDSELQGCPVNKNQLLEVISALLHGQSPFVNRESVCLECKRKGNVCVTVAHGIPCLGPLTQGGCGAICPSYNRGCYACFGPAIGINPESLIQLMKSNGLDNHGIALKFQGINSQAPAFNKLMKIGTDEKDQNN
ncbi:MAG: oxidoreductase [Nitrospiria bacterium]